jgi:hypothetical protein
MAGYPTTLIPPYGKIINNYLPMELLREIFLYSIESNQMKSGLLASVCRYWRSVITTMPHLWSTLRVETWTEREQVTTWLQRAYPKKVIIDTQRYDHESSNTLSFAALQAALESTGRWHELTISSFPSEDVARKLGFQVAMPMNLLRTLHVVPGCVRYPSSNYLLDLVSIEAPLSELMLHTSFSSAYFLQPRWFPVLKNLSVLIVNGRDIHEPFELLPAFTQLHTFGADHLPLPLYELNTNLPLICTLRKPRLRATSVQWMAGRQFPFLEECAILLPRYWEAVQQREVELPSCRKLAYHGYPMTTVQYFHAPQMRAMDLRSHDCKKPRVYHHLHHLFTMDGSTSNLITLHLMLQCSEQAFTQVVMYFGLLQELVLSIVHPSPSWQSFLESLAAKPSTKDWHKWSSWELLEQWKQLSSSQTWHADVLPHLKYLGIQCPKGFSESECLDNGPLLRLVGWTRAHLTPSLEHLKVWEGKGTTDDIVVDYISTGYLKKYSGIPSKEYREYDSMIVRGMVTQSLYIEVFPSQLFQLYSTVLFRWLQDLHVGDIGKHENTALLWPCMVQIKRLTVCTGTVPAYSLNIDPPLIHTLQWLSLSYSTFSWMLGRTFKALREFYLHKPQDEPESQSRYDGLQVELPACTTLELWNFSYPHFLLCPNVQVLRLKIVPEPPNFPRFRLQNPSEPPTFQMLLSPEQRVIEEADLKPVHYFMSRSFCLHTLEIFIYSYLGLDSLIQLVFRDAWEQGVRGDIKSVKVDVYFGTSKDDRDHFFRKMIGHQQHYKKWWNEFAVTKEHIRRVIVRASK